jgi:DNA-binding NarL/FixJ family response regulator
VAGDRRVKVTRLAPTTEPVERVANPADVIVVDTATYDEPERMQELADLAQEPIVAFGVPGDERHVIALAEAGVLGFVEREASVDQLIECILRAARGEATIPPKFATTLLRRVAALSDRKDAPDPDLAALTVRERQIVEIIAEGLSNKEIAARLSIEVATVKNHVHSILEKLNVSRRSEVVARLRLVESSRFEPTRSSSGSRAG